MITTKEALEPCPFCGVEGVPDPVNEGWFAIRHTEVCYFTQNGRDITAHHVPMHQNWNSRVSAPIAPVVDEDQQLVARVRTLVESAFIVGHCHGPSADYQVQLKFRTLKESQDCQTLIHALVHPESRESFIRQGVLEPFAPAATVAPQRSDAETLVKQWIGTLQDESRVTDEDAEDLVFRIIAHRSAPASPAALRDEAHTSRSVLAEIETALLSINNGVSPQVAVGQVFAIINNERAGLGAPLRDEAAPCINCSHSDPHDGPAETVSDACTHEGCNCGYYQPATTPEDEVRRLFTCPLTDEERNDMNKAFESP